MKPEDISEFMKERNYDKLDEYVATQFAKRIQFESRVGYVKVSDLRDELKKIRDLIITNGGTVTFADTLVEKAYDAINTVAPELAEPPGCAPPYENYGYFPPTDDCVCGQSKMAHIDAKGNLGRSWNSDVPCKQYQKKE